MIRVRLSVGLSCLTLAACASAGDPDDPSAWDQDVGHSEDTGADDADRSDTSDDDGGATQGACQPGEVATCLCFEGNADVGEQRCLADGSGWGICTCDDFDDADTDDDEDEGEPIEKEPEVCYPGEDNSWTTCFPIHAFETPPSGYNYPEPYQGNPNYRKPVAFIDLQEIPGSTKISPHFTLDEIAQVHKGRWAIVQPHAVDSLQNLRNAVGGIGVNSGYRSPQYNAQIGGATYSRHMYGDAFDMSPQSTSLSTLENQCVAAGGQLVKYTSHVHCDFRFDDPSVEFFGPLADAAPWPLETFEGTIVAEPGHYTAPAVGFDEGEPMREWKAWNAANELVATYEGPEFVPPPGAVKIEVLIGGRIELLRSVGVD